MSVIILFIHLFIELFYFMRISLTQFDYEIAWTTCTISERRTYIEYLLELLELQDPAKRFATTRRLLYIAQGN